MPYIHDFLVYIWNSGPIFIFRAILRNVFNMGWGWRVGQSSRLGSVSLGSKTDWSPVFALLIGIDNYESETIGNAGGAVHASNRVFEYLTGSLGVPESQIQVLCDEDATRENILNELSSLKTRREIVKGDPIIIYFSGRGSIGRAPASWKIESDSIDMILPFDTDMGVKGKRTYGIPASTISMILEDVSGVKGDNLVLMLDCEFDNQGAAEASPLPASLDVALWKNHKTCDPDHSSPSFAGNQFASHVVITSSGDIVQNVPFEHGAFTLNFLDNLKALKTFDITYVDLIRLLPKSNGKTPCVGGRLELRTLFNGKVSKNQYTPVPFTRLSSEESALKLGAGVDEGIRLGSSYNAYPNLLSALSASNALGSVEVTMVRSHFSKLSELIGAPDSGYAILKEEPSNNVIHLYVSENLLPFIQSLNEVSLAQSPRSATLTLAYDDDKLEVGIQDERVVQSGLSRVTVECKLDMDNIQRMIKGFTHYHWILNRTSDITTKQIASIDLYKLTAVPGRYTRDVRPYRVPDGPSVVVDGVARVKASRYVPYGINVTNHTSLDLYAYLFFFDNYDFSIMPYYLSDEKTSRPPLQANKSIKIGYEDAVGPPVIYYLRPGANIEVGFIKLFVCTRPLDMTHVQQPSPLSQKGWHEGWIKDFELKEKVWGTAIAKIEQLPPDSEDD